MSPELIRFRRLMAEIKCPTRDQMESWALIEIAFQLDRIADSLANMQPPEPDDTTAERCARLLEERARYTTQAGANTLLDAAAAIRERLCRSA